MTVLTACANAAVKLGQSRLTSLFSNSDTFPEELKALVDESATAIAQAHDWQKLLSLATLTGDSSATAFDLPADYDRMTKKGRLHSSSFADATFRKADDLDEWLYLTNSQMNGATPGNWIIIGGQMNIFPVISLSETARFYYITNKLVLDNASTAKATFTADNDTFRLAERLLTLDLVWRWKAQKGRNYTEDMRNFEIAQSEEIGKDKGSNVLVVGRQRSSGNFTFAYPGTLGP